MFLSPDNFQVSDYGLVKIALVQTVLHRLIWYLLDKKQIDPINEIFICSCLIGIFRSTDCIVRVRDPRTTARALRSTPSIKSCRNGKQTAGAEKKPRGLKKPSDHTPIWCELDIK